MPFTAKLPSKNWSTSPKRSEAPGTPMSQCANPQPMPQRSKPFHPPRGPIHFGHMFYALRT